MKITKTWARKMLKAVNEAIEAYTDGERPTPCPFCVAVNDDCDTCPWVVFNGYDCLDGPEGSSHRGGDYYLDTPIPQRLPRLYGWRKRLTNIIERGK